MAATMKQLDLFGPVAVADQLTPLPLLEAGWVVIPDVRLGMFTARKRTAQGGCYYAPPFESPAQVAEYVQQVYINKIPIGGSDGKHR